MFSFFSKISKLIWKQIVHPLSKPDEIVQLGAYSYELPKILSFGWSEKVVIGKFCSIAEDVKIVAGGEHNLNHVTTFPLKDRLKGSKLPIHHKGAIIIENDVWIGTGAIILAGVKIGNGAVVGAGSVVTHDVPAYAIVAGVPARVVKYRFTTDQIKKLLEIAWWNWDIEKIVEHVDYFHGNVDVFIEQFSRTGLVNKTEPDI